MPPYSLDSYESDPALAAFQAHHRLKRIRKIVDKKVTRSPLLQSQPNDATIARLPRSAIHTGQVVGEGAFAQVLAVERISMVKNCSEEQMALIQQLQTKAQQGQLVLKRVKPGIENYCAAAADLVTEAALLMRLSHPHLIQLHAVAPNFIQAAGEDGEFYLLLDRVDSTLADEVSEWRCHKRSVPTVAQRVDYAAQLASVLEYLHSQGIVYRDLKLDNVGLSKQPTTSHHKIQLLDLGLARQLPQSFKNDEDEEDSSFLMSMAGTPRYMAPEVALEQPYSTQADVYSWAILVWECMSLSYAFDGYTPEEHLQKVMICQERPVLAKVPSSISSLLEQSWRRTPSERPNMTGVLRELSEVEKAVTSRPFGLFRRRTSTTSTRKAVTASCA